MPTNRFANSSLVGVFLLLAFTAVGHTQDDKFGDVIRKIVPQAGGGSQIKDSERTWAYVAAVVGFVLVWGVAWFLVRLLALLTIVVAFFGGIAYLCWLLHARFVTTWDTLAYVTIYVGVSCCIVAITAYLYLPRRGKGDGEVGGLKETVTSQAIAIDGLRRELQELRAKTAK